MQDPKQFRIISIDILSLRPAPTMATVLSCPGWCSACLCCQVWCFCLRHTRGSRSTPTMTKVWRMNPCRSDDSVEELVGGVHARHDYGDSCRAFEFQNSPIIRLKVKITFFGGCACA